MSHELPSSPSTQDGETISAAGGEAVGQTLGRNKLLIYETDHYVPKQELIKESVAWLDKYLGPAK
jgi:hypothetical protein